MFGVRTNGFDRGPERRPGTNALGLVLLTGPLIFSIERISLRLGHGLDVTTSVVPTGQGAVGQVIDGTAARPKTIAARGAGVVANEEPIRVLLPVHAETVRVKCPF